MIRRKAMTGTLRTATLGLLALFLPIDAAQAQTLSLPANAEMTRELHDASGTYAVPIGPWRDGEVDTFAAEGTVTRQAWRVAGSSLTTLQVINQFADQLSSEGFETLYRCEDAACGGFDFRFALPVLPPPEMFVDLFDYRFIAARQGQGAQARYVTLLVSRSGAATYVQITYVTPGGDAAAPAGGATSTENADDGALVAALRTQGHVVLEDLDFGTGAAALGEGPFASLAALADFLDENPARRIALVGHTDTVGGYQSNLALSRQRAEAVMRRLVAQHGVAADRLEAEGIAYLAPVAPNDTAPGREANRRVEAVLLAGE